MDFIAVGGDMRFAYMVRLARETGMRAATLGLDRAGLGGVPEVDEDALEDADTVVMPNPFVKGIQLPLSSKQYALDSLLSRMRAGTTLLLFGARRVPDSVHARFVVKHFTSDEHLTRALARQSAEGAIHAVCSRAARELFACRVLLIGYGRIAQELHRMLQGYGAHVTVAARREAARQEAEARGAIAVDMEEMGRILPAQHIIFSTPPERVLDARQIDRVARGAMLLDLSSPPYGVDLAAAHARWLNAWREPGLPGRYCAESAGAAMLESMIHIMKGGANDGE